MSAKCPKCGSDLKIYTHMKNMTEIDGYHIACGEFFCHFDRGVQYPTKETAQDALDKLREGRT